MMTATDPGAGAGAGARPVLSAHGDGAATRTDDGDRVASLVRWSDVVRCLGCGGGQHQETGEQQDGTHPVDRTSVIDTGVSNMFYSVW